MKIKYHDIELLNKLFEMEGGYVLDFSDRTINLYFAEELNIDFSDEIYLAEGWSKAKRLRCFLKITERDTVIIVLNSLWQYKKNKFPAKVSPQEDSQFIQLIQRLQNADYETANGIKPASAYTPQVNIEHFKQSLDDMWNLDPQARGFKFEIWLNELFHAYHLMPRSSFRMQGV